MNTSDLLDSVKERLSLPSDYALARYLGVSHQAVSKLRRTNGHLGDEAAVKVAEALGKDPGRFLVEIHAARTKCPAARKALQGLAEKAGAVLIAAVVGGFGLSPQGAQAATGGLPVLTGNTHYAQFRGRHRCRGNPLYLLYGILRRLCRPLAPHSAKPRAVVGR
jgi:hypothetical protein